MKKIGSILLSFCLILSLILGLPVEALAANEVELSVGGSVSKINYSQVNNSEEIRIFANSPQIVKQYVIAPEGSVTHYRIVFEIANVSVPKTIKFDVNKGSVGQIRMANLSDPIRTSVVVETSKKPDYTLVVAQDGKSVLLTLKGTVSGSTSTASPKPSATPSTTPTPTSTPKPSNTPTPSATVKPSATPAASATPAVSAKPTPTPVPVSTGNTGSSSSGTKTITKNGPLSWTLSGDTLVITLEGISLSQATTGNTPRYELREKEKLIQVTIPGKDTRFTDGFLSGNSIIHGILVNYNEKQNATLVRISYRNTITYTHSVINGSSVFQIIAGSTTIPVTSSAPSPSATPVSSVTPTPSATPVPSASTTPTPSASTGSLSFNFNAESVAVSGLSSTGTKVYRLGNPSRIVMELKGTATPTNKVMASGSLYTKAVVSQPSSGVVWLELFTENMPDWSYTEGSGKGTLSLSRTNLTNITGGDGNGSVALRLVSTGIVNRYRQYANSITIDENASDGTITYVFPTNVINLGEGSAKIEDGLLKSIVGLTTAQSSYLMINKATANTQLKITEGSSADELLIIATNSGTVPSPTPSPSTIPQTSKLVVLDPGHGGSDPGAVIGSYLEKTYNLDIALRTEAILKSKGINVAMTRTTDVFVGLEERANFANERNASLFVSIHNNSMPTGYKGTMMLYYPTSSKGKAYAQVFLNNFVRDLKTNNLGLSPRGELVVLRKTTMPAVLAEIACMSDPNDMALLNTSEFIQKAAESLANSIIQILNSNN